MAVLGNRRTLKFWQDAWLDSLSIAVSAPDLARAVPRQLRNSRTVAVVHGNEDWIRDITSPRMVPVLIQYVQLRERLQYIILLQETDDRFTWSWLPSGVYMASSAYAGMFAGQAQTLRAKELWKARVPNKYRFFLWLVLHGRSWTSERAWRHGLRNDARCVLCDQGTEMLDHLLITCPCPREVWFKALRRCGWQGLTPTPVDSFTDRWLRSCKRIPKRWEAFDSFTILCAWCLWLERNARVLSLPRRLS
jgi:hypothetical protein